VSVEAEIVDDVYRFSSSITLPGCDIRVDVTITVPERTASNDVIEVSEVAQMAATHAVNILRRSGVGKP
jgi:hypothetical protein